MGDAADDVYDSELRSQLDQLEIPKRGLKTMTHFRLIYSQHVSHVYCSLLTGSSRETTHGNCGDFTIPLEEFEDLRKLIESDRFEFKEAKERGTRRMHKS